jgi:hypothetical protein
VKKFVKINHLESFQKISNSINEEENLSEFKMDVVPIELKFFKLKILRKCGMDFCFTICVFHISFNCKKKKFSVGE